VMWLYYNQTLVCRWVGFAALSSFQRRDDGDGICVERDLALVKLECNPNWLTM